MNEEQTKLVRISRSLYMTEEQMRAAIAKARGKIWHPPDDHEAVPELRTSGNTGGWPWVCDRCECGAVKFSDRDEWMYDTNDHNKEAPNYPESLDAMNEAEKLFDTFQKKQDYYDELCRVCEGCHVFMATARQRAIAFLRIIKGEQQGDSRAGR